MSIRALIKVCVLSLALLTPVLHSQSTFQTIELRMRANDLPLAVVPVYINGSGPFDFVVDTGSTVTMVDEDLAAQSRLQPSGQTNIVSVQTGETAMITTIADSVVVEGAEAKHLQLGVVKNLRSLPVKVRGVLGEDFLSRFDVLIDYEHGTLTLTTDGNLLPQRICGEKVSLGTRGEDTAGTVFNRLIVNARLPSLGRMTARLLLDTGTDSMVLFENRLALPPGAREAVTISGDALGGARVVDGTILHTMPVRVGRQGSEVAVKTLIMRSAATSDVDGMLPLSAFRSIFISHSRQYAIFNPILRTDRQIAYYLARKGKR